MRTKYVYFDNFVAKMLLEDPNCWNFLWDNFIAEFGLSMRPISSYYLFFEYFGFTKKNLEKPNRDMFQFRDIRNVKRARNEIQKIDRVLQQYWENACCDLEIQMSSSAVKKSLNDSVAKGIARISLFDKSQELKECLFGNILNLYEDDYSSFAQKAADFLAWDYFCNISAEGISTDLLRQRQLAFWLQQWDQRTIRPFGKLIDDFPGYYDIKLDKNTYFDGLGDMVDSEIITYLIMGLFSDNSKKTETVSILTCDPSVNIQERIELGLGNLMNMEGTLKRKISRCFGKVYRLNKDTFAIDQFFEPQLPIIIPESKS